MSFICKINDIFPLLSPPHHLCFGVWWVPEMVRSSESQEVKLYRHNWPQGRLGQSSLTPGHSELWGRIHKQKCWNVDGNTAHLPLLELLDNEGLDCVAGLGDAPVDHAGGVPGISDKNKIWMEPDKNSFKLLRHECIGWYYGNNSYLQEKFVRFAKTFLFKTHKKKKFWINIQILNLTHRHHNAPHFGECFLSAQY